jgi:uncharacterized coiled-coil DUF342 family protein
MALDEIRQRIEDLGKRYAAASKKKSELDGQLEAKKAELLELSREIKDAGYEPRKLKDEKERVESELLAEIDSCDKELAEVEAALREFDKK